MMEFEQNATQKNEGDTLLQEDDQIRDKVVNEEPMNGEFAESR